MVHVFCIKLDSPNVVPGGSVTGQVLLESKERIKTRGVRLTLSGGEKVHLTRTRRGGRPRTTRTSHYIAERVLVDSCVTLFGAPKGAGGEPVFLEAGRRFSFAFKFEVPRGCLPSCYFNSRKRISYQLQCRVDVPWWFDHNCEAALYVLPNLHVNQAPSRFLPALVRHMTPTACCCFPLGSLRMRVALPKAAFWWREAVPVEVEVDNSQCTSTINALQVGLRVVSTYTAKGHVDTHKHDLTLWGFHLSSGGIQPHAHEVKYRHTIRQDEWRHNELFPTCTIHGEHIVHKFVVRLIAKYALGKCTLELPVFMADGPFRSLAPEQAVRALANPVTGKPATSKFVGDPKYRLDYSTVGSGKSDDQMPSGKSPDDDVHMYERRLR